MNRLEEKRLALKFAARQARLYDESSTRRAHAMLLARDAGASLAEVSEATGVPVMTVKRIVDRHTSSIATLPSSDVSPTGRTPTRGTPPSKSG